MTMHQYRAQSVETCLRIGIPKAVVGGRLGELKLKKIDPKQLPDIQLKLNVITSPIAQEIRRSYTAGECGAEQAAGQWCRCSLCESQQPDSSCMKTRKVEATGTTGTRPPQKPRTSQYLEGSGDIKGGTDICGKPWTIISSSHAMSSRIWNLP